MNLQDLHRIRDAIAAGLAVRSGEYLTPPVIQDRANNITEYLRPIVEDLITAALKDAARGEVVGGLIDGARPKEEMAEDVAIGTVRPPKKREPEEDPPWPKAGEWDEPPFK